VRPGLVALLLAAAPLAGCVEMGLGQCVASLLPDGDLVRVHVRWNATGEPVPGACVRAFLPDERGSITATSAYRADDRGEATLRLAAGMWRLSAWKTVEGDPYCAYEATAEINVDEGARAGPAVLLLDRAAKVCA
jgi:hypothetical protein